MLYIVVLWQPNTHSPYNAERLTPQQYYNSQIQNLTEKSSTLESRLRTNSMLRLLLFLATLLGIYFTYGNLSYMVICLIVGGALFTYFVIKQTDLQKEKDITDATLSINQTEVKVLNLEYLHLKSGKEFIDPSHHYSNDIDLFGKGSFFQYINRTTTAEGSKILAELLMSNQVDGILDRQDAFKELAPRVEWRQHFSAVSSLIKTEEMTSDLIKWIDEYRSTLPAYTRFLTLLFPIISCIGICLTALSILPMVFLSLWFVVGLGISGVYFKYVQKTYSKASSTNEIFKKYHYLLDQIERASFHSKILAERQNDIKTDGKKASMIFKDFTQIIDVFEQRNNMLIGFLANGLFLYDLIYTRKTEQWIKTYQSVASQWIKTVEFFDAQNSLANFVYNHPSYTFPTLDASHDIIDSVDLGHPLLNPKKRVGNDLAIQNEDFYIITGANMAGKSTFLRTVSLSIVMANCGLPICATSYRYNPIKLITSMRTSDSLTEEASYFFAELSRLKFIVDEIARDSYFIVLDEILKGTNSKDKAEGSKKFVERLNRSRSTGIIATHDISLCELGDTYSTIENHYFDAEIQDDELHFDYKMKEGVCKNMNASFLLRKMQIVEE